MEIEIEMEIAKGYLLQISGQNKMAGKYRDNMENKNKNQNRI